MRYCSITFFLILLLPLTLGGCLSPKVASTPVVDTQSPAPPVLPTLPAPSSTAPVCPVVVTEAVNSCPAVSVRPESCLDQPGQLVERQAIGMNREDTIDLHVYLPPCYDEGRATGYPVLYLLHGSGQNNTAWEEIGATRAADRLIQTGMTEPFLIVMPTERDTNTEVPEAEFGDQLIETVLPWVDENFNTCIERNCRAIGGLSRGAIWALRLGLLQWQQFGSIGVHSFPGGHSNLNRWLTAMPAFERPRLYLDSGNEDFYVAAALDLEQALMANGYVHAWHYNTGSHNMDYWKAHVEEYLAWYSLPW